MVWWTLSVTPPELDKVEYEAPDVEIFEVSLPLNCKPEHEMFLSEASLGLHIVNPFDEEPTTIPV